MVSTQITKASILDVEHGESLLPVQVCRGSTEMLSCMMISKFISRFAFDVLESFGSTRTAVK